MNQSAPLLKISNWNEKYENSKSRALKQLGWVPIPNRMDEDGYTELLDHPNGAAHYGAWVAIIQIGSNCPSRGVLTRDRGDGRYEPHTAESMARLSRIPVAIFAEVLPRLLKMGWLVVAKKSRPQNSTNSADKSEVRKPNKTEKDSCHPSDGIHQEGVANLHDVAGRCLRARGTEQNRTEGKGTSTTAREAAAVVRSWPETDQAIRQHFPAVDDVLLLRLLTAARAVHPDVDDRLLAIAVRKTHRPNQRSPGMWLTAIPEVLRTYLRQKAAAS